MIVQEDVPYTKEEVKAMVKTIHDLREKVGKLGWHPASEKPIIPKDKEDIWVYSLVYGEDKEEKVLAPMFLRYTKLLALGWVLPDDMIVVWWCYPPKEIEDYDKPRNN